VFAIYKRLHYSYTVYTTSDFHTTSGKLPTTLYKLASVKSCKIKFSWKQF